MGNVLKLNKYNMKEIQIIKRGSDGAQERANSMIQDTLEYGWGLTEDATVFGLVVTQLASMGYTLKVQCNVRSWEVKIRGKE